MFNEYDLILVPLTSDALVLNHTHNTCKFISIPQILYQDSFRHLPSHSLTKSELQSIQQTIHSKHAAFIQLPTSYSQLSQQLQDLKLILIPLPHNTPNITQQYTFTSHTQQYQYLTNHTHSLTGLDHPALQSLTRNRQLIQTLWQTDIGQKLYNMARCLFYYDDCHDEVILLYGITVKDLEHLKSLRYYVDALIPTDLFAEQLKQLDLPAHLLASFIRFITLYYQRVHVHYLTLLSAFLKHYMLIQNVQDPIYPIHTLRFFKQEAIIAGLTEKDPYLDFTIQALQTGEPIVLLRNSSCIEHISHMISESGQEIALDTTYQLSVSSDYVPEIYTIDTFLDQFYPEANSITDGSDVMNVLYKIFESPQNITSLLQNLDQFDSVIVTNTWNTFQTVLDKFQQDQHCIIDDKKYADALIACEVIVTDKPVQIHSEHYYLEGDQIKVLIPTFNSQHVLNKSLLLQMYLAYKTHKKPCEFVVINLDSYKTYTLEQIMKSNNSFLSKLLLIK